MGWQAAKVDRAQMRPAVGFENWMPKPSDIRALKRAGGTFFEGEVEDLRKEAPPEEEPQLKLSLVWLSDMFVALVSVVLVLSVVCFGS